MEKYTVRIELHDADEADYANLHDAMEACGFVRWIENDDGVKFRLPTAEYNLINSGLDVDGVRRLASRAASAAKSEPTPWVLVTRSRARRWSGLARWHE